MSGAWAPGPTELRRAYESGEVEPSEVLDALLDRISRMDHRLGAFTLVAPDAPRQFDPALPLSGIPFAVKDLIDVEGQVTRAGSLVTAGARRAIATAPIVEQLRHAGAVMVGRTTTHEFAWGITTRHHALGGTVHPIASDRVAGGSSGGSAVAVATGMAPMAIGTDTGGSIRIPAGWCGVAGWKPSRGVLCPDGIVPLAPSLDVAGFLAPNVADLIMVARVLAPELDNHPATVRRRIGVPTAFTPALPPAIARVYDDAARRAQSAGIDLVEMPSFDGAALARVFGRVQAHEALRVHMDLLGTWPLHRELYGADVAHRLVKAEAISAADYDAARAEANALVAIGEGIDGLLLPVAACGPPTLADPDFAPGTDVPVRDLVMPFTVLANLTGAPAVVVPAGSDGDGLPVGVQVVAGPGADHVALTLARAMGDTP